MSGARAMALARFAAATNARMGITRIGLGAGLAILLLGPLLSLSGSGAWAFDSDLGFFGFLVAALFGLRSGLEEQRETGLTDFLRHNLASPLEHAIGLVLGLLATWLALSAIFFGAVLLVSGGDAGTAAWHSAAWGLRALLLLGFVPLVEALATLRLPFILPVIAYFALIIGLSLGLGEETALRLFAPVERGDPASLRAIAVQAVVVFPASSLLFVAGTAGAASLRGKSRHPTPSSH